jgi:3'-phosphoadenosine 5'-phosphosulfate sulfotransferase (PAPS reductase)/FAD synthetase
MNKLELIGLARLKSIEFAKKEERAISAIREIFEKYKNISLSISGGKDSVAMLGIVNRVANEMQKDFVLWVHVSDASFPGTIETIKECSAITKRRLIIDESPVSAFDVIPEGEVRAFGKKGYFFSAIKKFVETNRIDAQFIGVRAWESKRRRKACFAHGQIFSTTVPTKCITCFPIAWYQVEDVSASIIKYGLPFHPIYSMKGDSTKIRLGYVTAKDLLTKGTAHFIKNNYQELFNKLQKHFPEVRQYV